MIILRLGGTGIEGCWGCGVSRRNPRGATLEDPPQCYPCAV